MQTVILICGTPAFREYWRGQTEPIGDVIHVETVTKGIPLSDVARRIASEGRLWQRATNALGRNFPSLGISRPIVLVEGNIFGDNFTEGKLLETLAKRGLFVVVEANMPSDRKAILEAGAVMVVDRTTTGTDIEILARAFDRFARNITSNWSTKLKDFCKAMLFVAATTFVTLLTTSVYRTCFPTPPDTTVATDKARDADEKSGPPTKNAIDKTHTQTKQ